MLRSGLPPLRAKWIRDRGDVEEIEGREVTPIDDGYLSVCARRETSAQRNAKRPNSEARNAQNFNGQPNPLRATRRSALSLSFGTRARESSRPRWNSSRSAKMGDEAPSRIGNRESKLGNRVTNHDSRIANSSHQHRGESFGAEYPARNHARIRPGRSRARPRHHPREHQSSRNASR